MAPLVSSSRLENAEVQLRKFSLLTDAESADEYDECGGTLVARNVAIHRARAFLEKTRQVSFRYTGRDLFAVDFTGGVHGTGRSELIRCFAFERSLFFGTELDFDKGGDIWVPDHSFGPKRSLNPNLTPTLVVEFASAETLKSVYRSATTYLDVSTKVQIVICCKIWGARANGTKAMLFLFFERNNMAIFGGYVVPTRVVSFGTSPLHSSVYNTLQTWGVQRGTISGYLEVLGDLPCTGRNQPPYQINIPAAPIFHQSVFGIPQGVAGGFDIDLFDVQEEVV